MLKKSLLGCALALLGLLISTLLIDAYVSYQARGHWTRNIDALDVYPVALIPGTSKYVGKRLNLYYQHRVDAASRLYHQGVVKALLLSGDNRTRYYNEPVTMLNDMLEAGVPRAHIALDYAGFSTLDSIIRAKQIFGQDRLLIVSQQFHVERALFIAKAHGIEAHGFVVDDAANRYHWRVRLREVLARVKSLIDVYLVGTQPYFLGEPEAVNLRQNAPYRAPSVP